MTPDSADSTQNGTRIRPSSDLPIGASFTSRAEANSHRPLRFSQSFRTICGRGYSGRTLLGSTCLAHRVISGPCAGFQSGGAACAAEAIPAAAPAVVIIISHHLPKNDLIAWLDRRKVLVLSLAARPSPVVSRTVPV